MTPDYKIKGISGIYQIRNKINGKVYVGRTRCFYKRCHQYLYSFKGTLRKHINDHLLNSMKKYGIHNFAFEILEMTNGNLPEKELSWITKLRSNQKEIGYNIRLDVGGKMITDDRTSDKISSRLRKEWDEGKRDGHSGKLKLSWNNRDRKVQGELMSKSLTKYSYVVKTPNGDLVCNYQDLIKMGIENVVGKFSYYKIDSVLFKGLSIERRLKCG